VIADTSDITTAVHFLAVDVAKQWNAVLIETATGTRHRFKMANSAHDFDRLIQFIQNLGRGGRSRAALEPQRYSALSDTITKAEGALTKLDEQIKRAQESDAKMRDLVQLRRTAYAGVTGLHDSQGGSIR